MKKYTKLHITYLGGEHGNKTITIEVKGEPGELAKVSSQDVYRLMDGACGVKKCRCGQSMMSVLEPDWLDKAMIRIPKEGNEIFIKHTPCK